MEESPKLLYLLIVKEGEGERKAWFHERDAAEKAGEASGKPFEILRCLA